MCRCDDGGSCAHTGEATDGWAADDESESGGASGHGVAGVDKEVVEPARLRVQSVEEKGRNTAGRFGQQHTSALLRIVDGSPVHDTYSYDSSGSISNSSSCRSDSSRASVGSPPGLVDDSSVTGSDDFSDEGYGVREVIGQRHAYRRRVQALVSVRHGLPYWDDTVPVHHVELSTVQVLGQSQSVESNGNTTYTKGYAPSHMTKYFTAWKAQNKFSAAMRAGREVHAKDAGDTSESLPELEDEA